MQEQFMYCIVLMCLSFDVLLMCVYMWKSWLFLFMTSLQKKSFSLPANRSVLSWCRFINIKCSHHTEEEMFQKHMDRSLS